MQIVMKKCADLVPYEKNPRKNDGAVPAVAASIEEFGFKVPIVIDKDGVIVAGHTRLKAAKKLGMAEVPCIIADDLTDEQIKAFRLADNKTAEAADWNFDLLAVELADIASIDMSAFGFDMASLEQDGPDGEEDEYEEPEDLEPRSQFGDTWQLGDHRLVCGDSTSAEMIDMLVGDTHVDMVYTDPPYGMGLETDFSDMQNHLWAAGKNTKGGNKYDQGKVDEFTPEMIDAVMSINAKEVFVWGADYFAELIPGRNDGSWIVWDKRANGNDDISEDYSSDKMYGSCFELCWSKTRHKREIARVKWAGIFGLEQEFDRKRQHPTQKPIKLSEWFLNKYSKKGQTIVDLFGGSGSTLIACEQTGRKCRMMELDPHYCDVIIDRWEKFTGKKAVRIDA